MVGGLFKLQIRMSLIVPGFLTKLSNQTKVKKHILPLNFDLLIFLSFIVWFSDISLVHLSIYIFFLERFVNYFISNFNDVALQEVPIKNLGNSYTICYLVGA